MKLEDFVTQTLLDITRGVDKAQKNAPSWIAPGHVIGQTKKEILDPQYISFDVAVTTSKEGGTSINVLAFGKAEGNMSSQNVNKISFQVPVYFQAKK